jgi:hypothetical protein
MLEFCCTYIPNNTTHTGTITKAIPGLITLSNEPPEISGINDPFTDSMENLFGMWKGCMTSFLASLVIALRVLILAVC